MAAARSKALQQARMDTLGWFLGYSFALLNRLVVQRVQASGHPDFRPALSTLTRAMPPEGEARISTLADRASVTKQAMSQLVAEMSDLGLVRVEPDPDDRRAKLVSYTRSGERLARSIVSAARDIEGLCKKHLGRDALTTLRERLQEVIAALETETGKGPKASRS